MIFNLIVALIKTMVLTGSYSHNIFPNPLSKEDEKKYIEAFLTGDKKARNKLIEHNLRLVAHIVKKYDYKKDDLDDLISIGTIGLIKGIDTFCYKHGTRITTYCARCIENEILMHFRSDKKNSKNISLNQSIGYDKDGNEISFLDVLKTPKVDFIELISTKDNILLLKDYMKFLTERERSILIKRYGLDGNKEITQKRIAKELNISRSYVSRIEKRALTKLLREFIKNKKLPL